MKSGPSPDWLSFWTTIIAFNLYVTLSTPPDASQVSPDKTTQSAIQPQNREPVASGAGSVGLASASQIRILRTTDRDGNSVSKEKPEVLIGIDNTRALSDPWYRRRVTRYITHRFSRKSPGMNSAEGQELKRLFADHGVVFDFHWEIVTQFYDQLADYHALRLISDAHRAEESAPDYKPPEDPDFAASQRRYRAALAASDERAQALIRPILIERLQQNTGISDPAFYEELFKIRPKVGLGTIDISIGEDEVID